MKLIRLLTISNLFALEVVQSCQHCQLYVLRENSNWSLPVGGNVGKNSGPKMLSKLRPMSGNIFLTRPGKCKNFVAVVDVHEPVEVFGVVKYDLNLQYLVFKYICIVNLCLSKIVSLSIDYK